MIIPACNQEGKQFAWGVLVDPDRAKSLPGALLAAAMQMGTITTVEPYRLAIIITHGRISSRNRDILETWAQQFSDFFQPAESAERQPIAEVYGLNSELRGLSVPYSIDQLGGLLPAIQNAYDAIARQFDDDTKGFSHSYVEVPLTLLSEAGSSIEEWANAYLRIMYGRSVDSLKAQTSRP